MLAPRWQLLCTHRRYNDIITNNSQLLLPAWALHDVKKCVCMLGWGSETLVLLVNRFYTEKPLFSLAGRGFLGLVCPLVLTTTSYYPSFCFGKLKHFPIKWKEGNANPNFLLLHKMRLKFKYALPRITNRNFRFFRFLISQIVSLKNWILKADSQVPGLHKVKCLVNTTQHLFFCSIWDVSLPFL